MQTKQVLAYNLPRKSESEVVRGSLYLSSNGLSFKILDDLNKRSEKIESLSVEIEIEHSKNIILSLIYRLPHRGNILFEKQLKHLL